jgi:hypothetical protein
VSTRLNSLPERRPNRCLKPRMKRPLGVIILALFYFLGTVLFILVLVIAILEPAFVSGLLNLNVRQDIEPARTYEGVHVLLILIFAAIGLGLWFLQSWARWTGFGDCRM